MMKFGVQWTLDFPGKSNMIGQVLGIELMQPSSSEVKAKLISPFYCKLPVNPNITTLPLPVKYVQHGLKKRLGIFVCYFKVNVLA